MILSLAWLAAGSPASAEPSGVERAVAAALERSEMDGCFRWAEVDLDRKEPLEVMALVVDPAWCGTGGCSLVVFQWANGGLREVSSIALVDEVRVARSTAHAWNDIIVINREGTWRLRFDGAGYPENPTVAPATKTPVPRSATRPRWRSAAGCG